MSQEAQNEMHVLDSEARVANGLVRVGDWVRELPAQHFQPCYCCLCRPQSGERPVLKVRAIQRRGEGTYLRLADDEMYPADELERVAEPAGVLNQHLPTRRVPNLSVFLRGTPATSN